MALVTDCGDHPLRRAVDEVRIVELLGVRPLLVNELPGLLECRELRSTGQPRLTHHVLRPAQVAATGDHPRDKCARYDRRRGARSSFTPERREDRGAVTVLFHRP